MPVVLVEKQSAHTTVLTLNRPERRNALTIELMSELTNAVEAADRDPTQRILILRGAGKAFCTGLDLQEVSQHEKAHESAGFVAKMLLAISQTRLITIAAVHGAAVAGGAGIMSACDFVIAAERTKFGYPGSEARAARRGGDDIPAPPTARARRSRTAPHRRADRSRSRVADGPHQPRGRA